MSVYFVITFEEKCKPGTTKAVHYNSVLCYGKYVSLRYIFGVSFQIRYLLNIHELIWYFTKKYSCAVYRGEVWSSKNLQSLRRRVLLRTFIWSRKHKVENFVFVRVSLFLVLLFIPALYSINFEFVLVSEVFLLAW